jgi:hypothetical protein
MISRALLLLLAAVGLYVALAIGATAFGKPLARTHPSILSAFSFQKGPLSWSYSFDEGLVGPFEIGSSRENAFQSATRCKCFWAYPLAKNEPRVRFGEVPAQSTDKYFPADGEALISSYTDTGATNYKLTFANARLQRVKAYSYLLAGL